MPSFSIIIPVLNQPDYTRACLGSVLPSSHEVIVVDNGSRGRTRDVLASHDVRVVRIEENRGLAHACNVGGRAASGDYLVFLHNDCVVPRCWDSHWPDYAREMASGAIGVVTPLTNYSDEATFVQSPELMADFIALKPPNKARISADEIGDVLRRTYDPRGGLEALAGRVASPRITPVDETSSFCMIVPRSVLDDVGWLDASFPFRGYEDKELLFRMGLKGYRAGRADFFVHHFGNITSDGPGFNCRELKEANKPIFEALTRAYAAQARSEFDYSCVLYPDPNPDLARRALASINRIVRRPRKVVEVPPPGMFPERRAMAWALPQIDSEFTAVVDGDMILDPSSISDMAGYFSDPRVGCVAAMMRDRVSGIEGYFKVWRTDVLRRITFGDGDVRPNLPDTDYALGCERLGFKLLRVDDVVGEHGVDLDPWNVFRIYFRMGVKQKARGRIGTPAQTWGLDGVLKQRTPWAHVALVAFHCGMQVDYSGDVHGPSWDEFAWQHYKPVRMFCEALVAGEVVAKEPRRQRIRVALATRGMAMGGVERSIRLLASRLDKSRFEPIIMFDGPKDDVMLSAAEAACRVVRVGSEGEWTTALAEHSPDVVVSFLRTPVVEVARRMRIPVIERTPGWNGHSGLPKDNFCRVVCQYDAFRTELLARPELGATPDQTIVIRSLVEPPQKIDRAEARKALGIRPDATVMACVARVDPVKELSTQVRALPLLGDAELHVVGACVGQASMDEKASLERLAVDLGVSGRLFFHGVTATPSLYMCAADVVTLSSRTEGVPNCLLEAMSLGLPIAATRVGGVEEATMGMAALAPRGDPEAFACAVREALSCGPVSYPMERHDPDARARDWQDLLEDVYRSRYGGGDRLRIALLCEELCIGGMEMFARLMDELIDKRKFALYVYSVFPGPLAERLSCVVRVAGGPRELADRKVSRWIRDDKIDVAIIVSYRNADRAFAAGKPCRVIERLDGAMNLSPPSFPDVAVFQSDLLAAEMSATYAGKATRTIRNGRVLDAPRPDRAECRAELGVSDEIVVACVNRIAESKNNGMLADVALSLRARGVRARIFVMGPDWGARAALEARISSAGVGDMISIIEGSLDGPARLLAAADVYAHTSIFEGLSGAVIEACAAGLPVVAVNSGAMSEIVYPANGRLVKPNDAEAMAGFIASMSDSGRRLILAEGSRRLVKRFCARRMVREWESLVLEVAPQRDPQPALTIVMAAHGRCEHAGAAIDSVLSQTCEDWRLVVASDGPPGDDLRSIVRERADPRISLVEFPRGNHCRTLNAAVVGAGTDFWMRLDSDDMLSQTAVADVLAAIAANPGIDYFYMGDETIDEEGRHVSLNPAEEFSPQRLEEWHIARMPAVRVARFLECGGYPEDIPHGEDYFLALSMMLAGCRFMALPGCLYKYRQHDATRLSNKNLAMERESFIEMVRSRYLSLKKFSGVTLYGEEPGTMRPRRRIARRTL